MTTATITARGNFIGGAWRPVTQATGAVRSLNPADTRQLIWQQDTSTDAVALAVQAAREAWRRWRKTSLDERAALLGALKQRIDASGAVLAETIAREAGKALWEAKTEIAALKAKIDITLNDARRELETAHPDAGSMLSHHSHGVMAVLGPFNFPLSLSHGHIVPALLAGNTIVLKPSELTPAVAQLYLECFADFPAGVINLVQGAGDVGQALAKHPDVAGILFTGSYEVGRALTLGALDQPNKILALEMGGKNAAVVFPDANVPLALFETLFSSFVTTGQRCTATSRLVVVDDGKGFFDEFTRSFADKAAGLRFGDPFDAASFAGPLVAEKSLLKFQQATAALDAVGETLLSAAPRDAKGYFVSPHLVRAPDGVLPTVFRDEIFGPSVTVYRARDEEHAIALANDTEFGLALSVFTGDAARFERVLGESRAGIVNFNKGTVGATGKLPFGGVGKSGNFRPAGSFSVRYCSYPVATVIGDALPKELPAGFPPL